MVLPGPLIPVHSYLPLWLSLLPFISCAIVGEEARDRRQRARAESQQATPGGAKEMLRVCPISTFSVWGGSYRQGSKFSENVQPCSCPKQACWEVAAGVCGGGRVEGGMAPSPTSSDLLAGRKEQGAQRIQRSPPT